jgi:hypothetical protein
VFTNNHDDGVWFIGIEFCDGLWDFVTWENQSWENDEFALSDPSGFDWREK